MKTICLLHYIINTSAVNSIYLGSILIFASCVIHRPLVFPTGNVRVGMNSNCFHVSYYTYFILR